MKRILLWALILLVVRPETTEADVSVDTGSTRLIEVAAGVYALEPAFAGADGAVIINDDATIVVDSHGSPASAAALIRAAESLGAPPIRYVINTHWHIDHHSGNEAYRNAFGAGVSLISHDATRDAIPVKGREQYEQMAPYRSMPADQASAALESGHDSSGQTLSDAQLDEVGTFLREHRDFLQGDTEFDFTLPNITISEALTIHGVPHTIKILHVKRAHTEGDLVVYLPHARTLVIGDILTKPILWSWSSYPAEYIQTLSALEELDFDKVIIGHGGPVLDGKAYLRQVKGFLEVIVLHVEQSIASGIDRESSIGTAASNQLIQEFRFRFVGDTEQENAMFDQMVGWTIDRAFTELED